MLEVVFQHPQVEGEYLLWCVLEYLPQCGDGHPPDILHFVMLGNRFSIFHLTHKDKPHAWQTALELLLATERDKAKQSSSLGA